MIECESCSCWSHSECVNISPTVAANYPFICPYCVKSLFSSVSVLTSDITQLKDRLVKLENTCKLISTIISEIKSVQDFLESISHKVLMLSCSAASSISIPTSNHSSEPTFSSTSSVITLPLPLILHSSSTAPSPKFHPPYSSPHPSIAPPLNLHHPTAPPPILRLPSTAPPLIFHPLSHVPPPILHPFPFIALLLLPIFNPMFLLVHYLPVLFSQRPSALMQTPPSFSLTISSISSHASSSITLFSTFPPQRHFSSLLSSPKNSASSLTYCKSTSSQICHSSASFPLNQIVHHPPYLQDLMNNLASLLLTLLSPPLSPSNPSH